MRARTIFRDGAPVRTITSEEALQAFKNRKANSHIRKPRRVYEDKPAKEVKFAFDKREKLNIKLASIARENGYSLSKSEMEEFAKLRKTTYKIIVCVGAHTIRFRTFTQKSDQLRAAIIRDSRYGAIYEYFKGNFRKIELQKLDKYVALSRPKSVRMNDEKAGRVFECNSGYTNIFAECQQEKPGKRKPRLNNFGRLYNTHSTLNCVPGFIGIIEHW